MLLVCIALLVVGAAIPSEAILPLVAWHGLGQSCCDKDDKMRHYTALWRNISGNTYMKSLMLGFDQEDDKINSFILNSNLQVDLACAMIRADTNLWGGYNAVGASQGSQFLRALVQRCPWPPMRTLLTLGGQHQGVYGIPQCDQKYGPERCEIIRRALSELVYTDALQDFEVQAEYWHDPNIEQVYKEHNQFIADLNQEKVYHPEYKTNLMKLKRFVMVRFLRDTTVIPNISSWFGFYKPGQDVETQTLQQSALYNDPSDPLGLRQMDKEGKLVFEAYDDSHCDFSDDYFIYLAHKYLWD